MKEKYLIVIDVQNDFVDGSLGSEEAQKAVPFIVSKVENFDGVVLFTRDTHSTDYLSTQEGKYLPVVHCVEDTHGWELIEP
ncbi:MAG: isochorismatase family protein, partial [Lachnospiraceae bacterium]|nr:isochorismatase family protein [Candidatus Hippenecus merdae]